MEMRTERRRPPPPPTKSPFGLPLRPPKPPKLLPPPPLLVLLVVGRYVISVIINLICVFILQSNEHIEKLAHESDALLLFSVLSFCRSSSHLSGGPTDRPAVTDEASCCCWRGCDENDINLCFLLRGARIHPSVVRSNVFGGTAAAAIASGNQSQTERSIPSACLCIIDCERSQFIRQVRSFRQQPFRRGRCHSIQRKLQRKRMR